VTDAAQRFTLLYDQHHPRVLAYALSRAGREVAEEVTSATFLVAWERLDRLPDPPLPRARLLGELEDPAGRRGTGVTFPGSPEADRVFIVEEAGATLLATVLVAKDPAHFGVRVPPGTAILSTTWLETGWTDRLGEEP
jgi:hypothetical protein